MEQQKEGIRQEFMLLNWYLKEHLASAVRIAAFIGVFSLLCFLRNVPQDVTVYMIVLMAVAGAAGFCLGLCALPFPRLVSRWPYDIPIFLECQ